MAEPEQKEVNPMTEMFLTAYAQGLGTLRDEIEAYKDDANIWKVADGILNSGGTLCLHIVGNLNHFVGANLGSTGYIRERDLEFSDRGLSREELLRRIDDIMSVVSETLKMLTDESLGDDYPELLFDQQMSTGTVLARMSGHLSYHLGQLNYHRRLLDK